MNLKQSQQILVSFYSLNSRPQDMMTFTLLSLSLLRLSLNSSNSGTNIARNTKDGFAITFNTVSWMEGSSNSMFMYALSYLFPLTLLQKTKSPKNMVNLSCRMVQRQIAQQINCYLSILQLLGGASGLILKSSRNVVEE